ncbi:hypothetical protein ANO14919_068240 [Xylariales sp. No.14919]|nr:hypothetical protein ANO14919_068240 [Xylariales sp. No.14919]
MPSKFSYGVLRTLCVLAALLGIVAAAAADADKPIATLYTHFAGRKCHCGSKKQTILVGEAGAGNCYFLPNDTKTLSAEVEGDWNVFIFERKDCLDRGGWIFPQPAHNASVCHYDLGNATQLYYAVLKPDQNKYDIGGLHAKLDQRCHKFHL